MRLYRSFWFSNCEDDISDFQRFKRIINIVNYLTFLTDVY